jgi:hypothetical protein
MNCTTYMYTLLRLWLFTLCIHSHAAFSLMLKGGNLAEAVQEHPPLNEALRRVGWGGG